MRAIGPAVVWLLSKTWRTQLHGIEHLGPSGRRGSRSGDGRPGLMIALWHGRMLVGVDFGASRDWTVLVSPSADGDISERMLERFGYRVIRGSTSRGGARALREMLNCLRGGDVVILTPDGPRGPRHSMNAGLAWMSRATGFPIVPMGLVADRAWHLSSWDAFTIPKPFAHVALVFGPPIQVPRDADEAEQARATDRIRDSLFECERAGFARVRAPEDW